MAALAAISSMPIAAAVKVERLAAVVDSPAATLGEQQSALATLGALRGPGAVAALSARLDALATGGVAGALQLDLLQAARTTGAPSLLARLEQLGAGRTLEGVAAALPEALEQGGSAQRGRRLAANDTAAQCTRCHTLGNSVSDVGPSLNGIGARLSRAELVESLLDPGATLAAGFENDVDVSPMPPMGAVLEPGQIRDLVEFLATEGN
jgi:mono/diheme cytochrome c family protein